MFNFFRRNTKKDLGGNELPVGNNSAVAVSHKDSNKRPFDTCASPQSAYDENRTPRPSVCQAPSPLRETHASGNVLKDNPMAPMAAFRGKGKAKKKSPSSDTPPPSIQLKPEQAKQEQLKSEQVKSAQLKPELVKPEQVKSTQLKPELVKPELVKAEQDKSAQLKPELVKPELVKAEQVKSAQLKPELVKAEQIKSAQLKPELSKAEQVKSAQLKPELVKAEQIKSAQLKPELSKAEQVKSAQLKPELVKPELVKSEQQQNFQTQNKQPINAKYQMQLQNHKEEETTINSKPQIIPKQRQPLSYSKILQRLDSIPPMSPSPDPEKRRHSVKPCSHVTVAASPRILPPPSTPSPPPGSPVPATRSSRVTKLTKTDQDIDTVKATMKLHIDMPTINSVSAKTNEKTKELINGERTVAKCSDSDKKQVQAVVNGKIDTNCDKEKRNLVNQETQFQTQLSELSDRLRAREAEASELRAQMETLQQDLHVKTSGVDRLQAELTAAHKDSEGVRQKLRHLQDEVQDYKQKNAEMVEEVQKKADEYKTLEQSSKDRTAQLEASVKDLTDKLSTLETHMTSIREERDRLEKRRAELESEREEEKRIVQEALDAATSENDSIRRRWEQDFERLRTVNTDREQQMLDDFEWKLREVQAACKKRLEEKDKQAELKIKEAQKDVDSKVKAAESQMNEVLHLKSYEAEVTQLRGLTNDQQCSLRTMFARVEELQASEQNLHEDINRLQAAIEIEKREQIALAKRHEKDLADKERALQIRLEKQRGEVAVQWEQKLRKECARLTAELEQMHNDEKQLAVELVKVQKDREYETVRDEWERKVQLQLEEISDLKNTLARKDDKHQTEIERLRTNTDRGVIELRRELDRSEMAFHERTEKLLEEHEKELDKLNEEAERRLKELEQNSQMQMSSMRTTLELVKEQAARDADERIQKLEEEHQRTKDELWNRLTDEKEKEFKQIEQDYQNKFTKLKEQFMIVQKTHQHKEQDFLGKIKNLAGEIHEKSSTIEGLQSNVDTLHGGVQVLRQEIAHQDQTLTKVKADAEQKIGELQHALKVGRDTLQVEREEHIEEITHIQKQAQANTEQLQRRCQCLTKLFEDMRARYDKRESRSEDLNLITDLRAIIAEQERDLAVLNEEKRYFQMKLMKNSSSEESSPPTQQWKDGQQNHNERSRSNSAESNVSSGSEELKQYLGKK